MFLLATQLVSPRNEALTLHRTFASWVDDGLALAASLVRGEADEGDVVRFLPRMADLDALIENGATDAPWIGPGKPVLRGAMLSLAECVTAAALSLEPGEAAFDRRRLADELDGLRPRALAGDGPRENRTGERGAWARAASVEAAAPDAILARTRLARSGLAFLHRDRVPAVRRPVARRLDRDGWAASLGALRAALAMALASLLLVVTRWPSGGDFVEITGIICCLFASRPSPVVNGEKFAAGTVATGCLALAIGFTVLPLLSGFESLAAVLFPVLFAGALGIRSKTLAPYFVPLNFFFLSTIAVQNQMSYDPLTFFNTVPALVAGALHAVLWFQLIPPLSDGLRARRLERRLADAVLAPPQRDANDEERLLGFERLAKLLRLRDEAGGRSLVRTALAGPLAAVS